MNIIDRLRRLAISAAVTAGVIVITSAGAGLGAPALAAQASVVTRTYILTPMPTGTLTVSNGSVHLSGAGYTPSSSHEVVASYLGVRYRAGTLTASATGVVDWTHPLTILQRALEAHGIRPSASGSGTLGVHLLVLNADDGTPAIAQTTAPITGPGTYTVDAVEPGWGTIRPGTLTVTYIPYAGVLTFTVTAYGLSPGAHAAHVHAGTCQGQGPVVYPLTDYIANSRGAIVNQTRVITGVTSVSAGWYFNLHQGNSGNITSNGQPTINFRPLLCSNL